MKDKLTKKRIKVDYLLVIACARQEQEFLAWQKAKRSKISFNRLAYAFCKHKNIDVETIFSRCLEKGISNYEEYMQEIYRIAKTPWLDED